MTELARKLARWRDANGYSNLDAATMLGVNSRTWEGWVCGRRQPKGLALSTVLERIALPRTSDKAKARRRRQRDG